MELTIGKHVIKIARDKNGIWFYIADKDYGEIKYMARILPFNIHAN